MIYCRSYFHWLKLPSFLILTLGNVVSVVSQAYAVNLMEEYVLRGNAAILKCHIPSFVSEYVTVVSWIVSEGAEEVEINLDSNHNLDGTMYIA